MKPTDATKLPPVDNVADVFWKQHRALLRIWRAYAVEAESSASAPIEDSPPYMYETKSAWYAVRDALEAVSPGCTQMERVYGTVDVDGKTYASRGFGKTIQGASQDLGRRLITLVARFPDWKEPEE